MHEILGEHQRIHRVRYAQHVGIRENGVILGESADAGSNSGILL